MKKLFGLFSIIFIIAILTGCGTIENPVIAKKIDTAQDSVQPVETAQDTFQAEVIDAITSTDAASSLLVTPDKDSNEARSSDKISVTIQSEDMKNSEGDSIIPEEIKIGDILKIDYNGVILESYPAQISANSIEVVGHNHLIDGYLALIDDIYQEDDGLNGDIEMIALDTTGWVGLTEIEKEIIFSQVKKAYGYDTLEGTFDELSEQGIINEKELYFEKGILIKISEMNYDEAKGKITCAISKWRGGTGAIGSDDATAQLKDGVWNITKESIWKS